MAVKEIKLDWYPGEMKVNTYVVEFDDCCVIVDCGAPIEMVRELTDKPIKAVLITHGHYDHVMHIEDYDKLDVPIYANFNTEDILQDSRLNVSNLVGKSLTYELKNMHKLYEDDMIMVGENAIYAYYTPGHSVDSMVYLIGDTLFTGDTLFSVAVGRTDLPTGDTEALIESLNKFTGLKYKDVYAGHGRKSSKDEQTTNIFKWQNFLKQSLTK